MEEIPERIKILFEILDEHDFLTCKDALREFRIRTMYEMSEQKFSGYLEGLADAGIIRMKKIGQTKIVYTPHREVRAKMSDLVKLISRNKKRGEGNGESQVDRCD